MIRINDQNDQIISFERRSTHLDAQPVAGIKLLCGARGSC